MGGEICYQKGKEHGPWFEIKCVKETILNKEARGEDASSERRLLKSWSKHPGWEDAGKPFRSREELTRRAMKVKGGGKLWKTKN